MSAATLLCRKCGQVIKPSQYRFGSPRSGWEHMAGECPEPPIGTWVKDRHGGVHYRTEDGWAAAPSGFYAFGRWAAMWVARGPLIECGPWGREA